MENEERINNLKKHLFYELLDMAGRVMVLVKYSPGVIIGNRGFVGKEKEAGIVLVFTPKMKFTWDDYGIAATLAFGSAPQKCFIPAGSIAAVYSPELNVQFVSSVSERQAAKGVAVPQKGVDEVPEGEVGGNVISVDFVHRKKLNKDENE